MIGVRGEGGAHHVAGLLAHVLLAALGEHLGDRRLQDLRLLGREVVGEEQVALRRRNRLSCSGVSFMAFLLARL